ncbi:MAG TPA: type II toxin-antitoxin system VapC family toxin [Terracidiphilus sp.]|nr:type II toxin-antitoxin system VapC family toxin [Terracidiphilus sp.]
MKVCADSSFIAPLYIPDSHLREARNRLIQKPDVVVTPLNRSELAHTFQYQVFRQRIRPVEAQLAWEAFLNDCSERLWFQVPFPVEVWNLSVSLAAKYGPSHGIRTLDTLHVACALQLKVEKFWTFDERQARLAEAAGLDTSA